MFRSLLDAFWNEEVWLPPNTTWEDVAPGPDKAVVYTDHRHLLLSIPLALALIALRHSLEKYIFTPFGKYLGIEDTKPKKVPYIPKLEAEYQSALVMKQHRITALAKQLDLSERQVERWWRLRRSQDQPSTLEKFCENMWKCTFYGYSFSYGLFVLWDKEWMWDISYCYIGYPHQGITNDIWWYLMTWLVFHVSDTMCQFWNVRRKGFWQIFVHHIATITMTCTCWVCNMHRYISLGILLHDCAEVPLEAMKAAKYANYQRLSEAIFYAFTILWFITRLGIVPFYIVRSTLSMMPAAYYVLHFLIFVTIALNLLWTWAILKLVYKIINTRKVMRDVRSSSSEMSDCSQ